MCTMKNSGFFDHCITQSGFEAGNLTPQKRMAHMRKHRFRFFRSLTLASIFFLIEAHLLQAQTAPVDRAQLLQSQTQPPFGPGTTPSGVTDDHAAASPNDTDIGEQQILKRTEEYQPFTISLASPIFYTSNVALTNSNEKGDVVIAPVASVYYDPRITKTLYGHFGAREQIFYYGKYDAFNFGSLDAEAGLR